MKLKNISVSGKQNNLSDIRISGRKRPYIIAVMGLSRGVGTTYLAIMTAVFFQSVYHYSVALAEFNDHNDYLWIGQFLKERKESLCKISYQGIDFYRSIDQDKLANLMLRPYDIIIMDMIYDKNKDQLQELFRADCRIVAAGLSMWNIRNLIFFLKEEREQEKNMIQYVTVSYDKNIVKELEREYSISIYPIPLERNPFCISGSSLIWFEKTFCNP